MGLAPTSAAQQAETGVGCSRRGAGQGEGVDAGVVVEAAASESDGPHVLCVFVRAAGQEEGQSGEVEDQRESENACGC